MGNDANADWSGTAKNDYGKAALENASVFGQVYGGASGGKKDPLEKFFEKTFNDGDPSGNDYGNIQWGAGDKDVYSQMDAAQWQELGGLRHAQQADWITKRKQELATGTGRPRGVFQSWKNIGQTPDDPAAAAAQAEAAKKEAAFQQWRQDTMTKLSAYADEMNMPVEQLIAKGDLGVMNAGATGRSMASAAASSADAGLGGLSAKNTQRAVTDAQSKYQLQRSQLGLGATTQLLNTMGQVHGEGEDTRRYEQNMNLQMQQANQQASMMQFAQKQQQQGQLFGMIGGAIGGPSGYSIGSGLGQMSAGQYKPSGFSYPQGSSVPGSGGSGLGNYKNNYGGSQ